MINIFVIDDDLVALYASIYKLEQAEVDVAVKGFDGAQKALDYLSDLSEKKENFPEVILLDLVMPVMNGWGFLEAFERLFGNPIDSKIYILSALENSKDRIRAKKHPKVSGVFVKPISQAIVQKIALEGDS